MVYVNDGVVFVSVAAKVEQTGISKSMQFKTKLLCAATINSKEFSQKSYNTFACLH